jgi:hypothetical protein
MIDFASRGQQLHCGAIAVGAMQSPTVPSASTAPAIDRKL